MTPDRNQQLHLHWRTFVTVYKLRQQLQASQEELMDFQQQARGAIEEATGAACRISKLEKALQQKEETISTLQHKLNQCEQGVTEAAQKHTPKQTKRLSKKEKLAQQRKEREERRTMEKEAESQRKHAPVQNDKWCTTEAAARNDLKQQLTPFVASCNLLLQARQTECDEMWQQQRINVDNCTPAIRQVHGSPCSGTHEGNIIKIAEELRDSLQYCAGRYVHATLKSLEKGMVQCEQSPAAAPIIHGSWQQLKAMQRILQNIDYSWHSGLGKQQERVSKDPAQKAPPVSTQYATMERTNIVSPSRTDQKKNTVPNKREVAANNKASTGTPAAKQPLSHTNATVSKKPPPSNWDTAPISASSTTWDMVKKHNSKTKEDRLAALNAMGKARKKIQGQIIAQYGSESEPMAQIALRRMDQDGTVPPFVRLPMVPPSKKERLTQRRKQESALVKHHAQGQFESEDSDIDFDVD